MAETVTVNQENNGTAAATQAERTFTQKELDDILQARLGKERSKYADYEDLKAKAAKLDEIEAANKTELQKATEKAEAYKKELEGLKKEAAVSAIRAKVATDKNIPVNLLTADTEEACIAQAEGILNFAKPGAYPVVRDGGEIQVPINTTPQDQFINWFNESVNKN